MLKNCFLAALLVFVPFCSARAQTPEADVVFVFRFDDYPGSFIEVQKGVITLFRDRGVPLTVAAIPALLEQNAEALSFLAGSIGPMCEAAVHGWDHSDRFHAGVPSQASELIGLSVEEQYERITRGLSAFQERLEIKPATFVPPFNTYDGNTVEALRKAGVQCLSADIGPFRINHDNLLCVPQTCTLQDIVKLERFDDGLYIVMLHEYDFVETKSKGGWLSLENLDNLLRTLSARPHAKFFTVAALAESGQFDLSAARLECGQALAAYPGTGLFTFPAHWVRQMPLTYGTVEGYNRLLRRAYLVGTCLDVIAALVILGLAAGAYGVAARLRERLGWRRHCVVVVPVVTLIAVATVLILSGTGFGYKDRLVLAAVVLGGLGAMMGSVCVTRCTTQHGRSRNGSCETDDHAV